MLKIVFCIDTKLLTELLVCSYLLPGHASRGKQKTGICRRTTSPRWEQTVSWDDLTLEEVADRSIELAVWDHDRLGHQDFLGGVRFNLGTGQQQTGPLLRSYIDSREESIPYYCRSFIEIT